MEQRISLVTLGVTDVTRAREFYERLGWVASSSSTADVVFFQAGGIVVGIWGREDLAKDSGVADTRGWGGVTLAHNVSSPADVDEIVAVAEAAGATVARRPGGTFWGGYSGMFIDPDGHPWEVAHNPGWDLHEDGSVTLPE